MLTVKQFFKQKMVLGGLLDIMAACYHGQFCFYEILDNPLILACRSVVNTVRKKDKEADLNRRLSPSGLNEIPFEVSN